MGRKKVSDSERKIPVTIHSERYKVEAIGLESLKETLLSEVDKKYLKIKK